MKCENFFQTTLNLDNILLDIDKDITQSILNNIAALKMCVEEILDENVKVIDMTNILSSEKISELEYPNEHLAQNGRDIVAHSLLQHLN
jgi:hypothetical protein